MIELLHDLVPAIGLAIIFGGPTLMYQLGRAVRSSMEARDERIADEQEHRQKLERDRARAEAKLATSEKLHEVMAILIADRDLANAMRDEIDQVHPLVRVQTEEEAEEDDRSKKRSRRRR